MSRKLELPNWFSYPKEYQRIQTLNLIDLEPWFILNGDFLINKRKGLQARFPSLDLVPFARRQDNDDVACWEKSGGNLKVFIVHDYSDCGWDNRKIFESFWDWFKKALDDMIDHGQPYR